MNRDPEYTSATHWWKGAAPSLIKKPVKIEIVMYSKCSDKLSHSIKWAAQLYERSGVKTYNRVTPQKRKIEPSVPNVKYFTTAVTLPCFFPKAANIYKIRLKPSNANNNKTKFSHETRIKDKNKKITHKENNSPFPTFCLATIKTKNKLTKIKINLIICVEKLMR